MRIQLDKDYLKEFITSHKDILKLVNPTPEIIIKALHRICPLDDSLNIIPDAWLSDTLFFEFIAHYSSHASKALTRWANAGKLPQLTNEQKYEILEGDQDAITFFPDLPLMSG